MGSHTKYSPSDSPRWMECAGALALTAQLPSSERDSGDNIHTRRGTCAHTVGELVLDAHRLDPKSTAQASDYLGMTIENVTVDEEIVAGVDVYVEYCLTVMDGAEYVAIEQKYKLDKLVAMAEKKRIPFETKASNMGGTSDLTVVDIMATLHIIDYKNGTGMVEAGMTVEDMNTQIAEYGIGAILELQDKYDIEDVVLTIVQPNGRDKSQPPVRHYETTVTELLTWALGKMRLAINLAEEAEEALKSVGFDMTAEEWGEKYLVAGDKQCHWCPVKPRCTANMHNAADNALLDFQEFFDDEGDLGYTIALTDLPLVTPEQEHAILCHADQIIGFVKAIQQRAHMRAEDGANIEGFKLVRADTHRKLDTSDEKALKKFMSQKGLRPVDYLTEPKYKSPNQIENAMRTKGLSVEARKKFAADFVDKPLGAIQLVHESDKREAVSPAIEAEFEEYFDSADDMLEI